MNITTYLLDAAAHRDAIEYLRIDKPDHPARDLTELELSHWGFAPEAPWHDGESFHFDVVHTERVLPAEVVNLKLDERLRKLELDGSKVTANRRKEERELLLKKLIPEAPQRKHRIAVCLRPTLGMVLIATAKAAEAEAVLSLLRRELGSFPAMPLDGCGDGAVQLSLTEAVLDRSRLNGALSEPRGATVPFALDRRAVLKLPGYKAAARFTDMNLRSEEVQECLRNGMRVESVGMVADEMIEFEVDKNLVLRRFEVTDVDEDRMDDALERWGDTSQALRVIRFAEAGKVLDQLAAWMEVTQPLAPERQAA